MKKHLLCFWIVLKVIYCYGDNYEDKIGRKLTQDELIKIDSLLVIILNRECVDTLSHLLSEGINVNTVDKNNRSFLWYAAKNNSLEIVRYLVKNGADVNMPDNKGPYSIDIAQEACYDMLRSTNASK